MTDAEVLERAEGWRASGLGVAVATVTRTWGSAPRPIGSRLTVNGRGEFLGSVSGGCIESAVVTEALEVLRTGERRVVEYGVSDERAWEVGLACGGALEVRIERIETGEALASALRADPPPRLLLVGAVHVAQSLAPMARLAGLDVAVIDPRTAFATEARFPGVELVREWPDAALARIGLDQGTALVALSHDPKLDDLALVAALRSPAFYVGALGSRKTAAARRERLLAAGLDASALERLHAPVGLDIGSVTPPEIAVSVLAELIGCLRGAGD